MTDNALFHVEEDRIICNRCNCSNPIIYGSRHYTDCELFCPYPVPARQSEPNPRRYEPIEYDEMPGMMVTEEDFLAAVAYYSYRLKSQQRSASIPTPVQENGGTE